MKINRAGGEWRRFKALARRLSDTGLILQGTITERTIERQDPEAKGQTRVYGPYYQWTFKEAGKTITVRKISFSVGVERIFLLNSPRIEKIELVKQGRVRRSRLYYLRGLSGKSARIEEKNVREAASPEKPAARTAEKS